MAIARAKLVDLTVTRWYHCVSRCVRKAFLLGEAGHNRKEWLENRLEELAEIFAVAVGGFSVMDNHLHVLLRLDPEVAHGWSDLEVVQRWGRLFPPRDKSRQPMPVTELKLVEYTGRLFRQGKASIPAELAGIFERLGFTAESWRDAMDKLRGERLLGRIFAASRIKLREIAKHLGVRHLINLRGCPLR